jgi:hypothetical protein
MNNAEIEDTVRKRGAKGIGGSYHLRSAGGRNSSIETRKDHKGKESAQVTSTNDSSRNAIGDYYLAMG